MGWNIFSDDELRVRKQQTEAQPQTLQQQKLSDYCGRLLTDHHAEMVCLVGPQPSTVFRPHRLVQAEQRCNFNCRNTVLLLLKTISTFRPMQELMCGIRHSRRGVWIT
jgi:hypothetical protein